MGILSFFANSQEILPDISDIAEAVCVGGDCYDKYEGYVVQKHGEALNTSVKQFLDELIPFYSKKVTSTSVLNRQGKAAGISQSAMKNILHWRNKVLEKNWKGNANSPLVILVIACNATMGDMHPLRVAKTTFVEKEVSKMIESFKTNKWIDNIRLSIINFAERAEITTWPISLKDTDWHTKVIQTTPWGGARISEGLMAAMHIVSQFGNANVYTKSYIVLISDGADDVPELTRPVLDAVRQKWGIEFYAYFVDSLTDQRQNDWLKQEFFRFVRCISLNEDLTKKLDWWFWRDVIHYKWYEPEPYYKERIYGHH